MPFISPVLGAGQIHGNSVLRGSNFVNNFQDAITTFGFELQFFSKTEELVGLIGTNYEKSNMVRLSMKTRKIKDLESFKFEIGRQVDIPFFDGMEVRFFYNGIKWFTGILNVSPSQESRNVSYEYSGKGWSDLFKRIKVNELYENKTLDFIWKDLITTYLSDTLIIYIEDNIQLPAYTVVKKEWKNKTLEKAFNELIDIANVDYNNNQYRYGVNRERQIFVELIDSNIKYGFFEGFQFQDPEIESNNDDIINKINLYRSQENSQTVEFISTVSDSASIDKWGEREKNITISDYIDTTTAERIATRIIEQNKEPVIKAKISNLNIEDEPFDFGYYSINSRIIDYITNISDFENTSSWDLTNISNTTITASDENTLTLKRAFKCELTSGSKNEYIEFILDDEFYFPDNLIIFASVNQVGDFFKIRVFDIDNEYEDLTVDAIRKTEDSDIRITEEGDTRLLDSGTNRIDILGRYIRLLSKVQKLNSIKKIQIIFLSNEDVTIYFDRLDIEHKTWKQNILVADEFEYIVDKANNKVNAVFNREVDNLIDNLKKLNDRSENIINIFEKS
jgi:hypothetical protein